MTARGRYVSVSVCIVVLTNVAPAVASSRAATPGSYRHEVSLICERMKAATNGMGTPSTKAAAVGELGRAIGALRLASERVARIAAPATMTTTKSAVLKLLASETTAETALQASIRTSSNWRLAVRRSAAKMTRLGDQIDQGFARLHLSACRQ